MKKISLLILMAGNMIAASAFKIEYGNNITISNPVWEDLYIAGGTVNINAPVHGDLIIAGGTVVINDTVTNDIFVAGGEITFNSFAGDDIRCAGGNIHIHKNVAGDVVVTGGSVVIHSGATVGGLITGGGNVTVDGNVDGEVRSAAGDLLLNGNVAKNIDCRGGRITVNGSINGACVLSANDLIIGSNAAFHNDVRYWNKKGSPDFKQSLKNSKATYDDSLRMQTGRWYFLGAATVLAVLWYLGMALLMIFIIQYLFSGTMKKAADTVFNRTAKSLGLGLLFFIGVPLAVVLAFVTLIGLPVGLLLLVGYIIAAILATVITSAVAANWYNNRNNHNWSNLRLTFAAFGIFILIKLLSSIPFLGWLITGLLVCVSFGSIMQNIKWRKRSLEII
jgi:cytoskeletal protein CcmA (bactofilin family)